MAARFLPIFIRLRKGKMTDSSDILGALPPNNLRASRDKRQCISKESGASLLFHGSYSRRHIRIRILAPFRGSDRPVPKGAGRPGVGKGEGYVSPLFIRNRRVDSTWLRVSVEPSAHHGSRRGDAFAKRERRQPCVLGCNTSQRAYRRWSWHIRCIPATLPRPARFASFAPSSSTCRIRVVRIVSRGGGRASRGPAPRVPRVASNAARFAQARERVCCARGNCEVRFVRIRLADGVGSRCPVVLPERIRGIRVPPLPSSTSVSTWALPFAT